MSASAAHTRPAPHSERRVRPRWQARWRNWWRRRLPASDQLELTQRNVYILPTRAGLLLALTLLVLLIGSINYQLNLGYLLTFLIAGSALAALHLTHGNLNGLRLQLQPGEPVFAGEAATVTVTLHNPTRRERWAIALDWLAPGKTGSDAAWPGHWTDLPAQAQVTLRLRCVMPQRGRHALAPLQAQTRFPLGILRAWCWWRPAALQLVYPKPETPAPPLPPPTGEEERLATQATSDSGGGNDEWEGVRPWRRGDPLRWVAWKKVARQAESGRDDWVSRDFARPGGRRCWLDEARTGLSEPEQRLSRLCAWVLAAEAQQLDYGLRLGALEIAPGHGAAQRQRCLEALALC